ncbi:MAG: hypothetical protein ACYDA9_10260 [Terriglobia bacterium]
MQTAAIFWIPVGVYNPLLALILALFFALSVRLFILFFMEGNRRPSSTLFRLLAGTALLVLGWFYFLFVRPQLVWDRPARAVGIIMFVGVLLWTVVRHSSGQTSKSTRVIGRLIYIVLFAVLMLSATLTLIRAGYIGLTGHRVTLVVSVTGETRNQTVSGTQPGDSPGGNSLVAHHVIIWLPTNEMAADIWIEGDEMAVHGKVIRFSRFLHGIGIPYFYALQYAHNGYLSPERQTANPAESIPFPGTGPLAVHPWWRPIQERLLNLWAKLGSSGSWYAIRIADDESPYYPLVDSSGKAIHKDFLLVLRPTGIATSKASSPLEDKQSARK